MHLINHDSKTWLANISGQPQLAQMAPGYLTDAYVRASEIGITADDKNHQLQPEAAEDFADLHINNLSIIKYYANLGYRIYMDMESVDIANDANYSLTGDLHLEADENRPCTLNITVDVMFTITAQTKNICFKNIKFIGSLEEIRVCKNNYAEDGALALDKLIVCNCEFEKSHLLYASSNRLYVEKFSLSYIKHFQFISNTVRNVRTTFCLLVDIAFDLVEIKNNNINNFLFILFNFGTSNLTEEEKQYPAYVSNYNLLVANKNHCEVKGNTVINDLDWVQTTKSTLYHTFILAECAKVTYTNNYVEGLKASINIATYDFYANSPDVRSENNVWVNNLCWAADSDNNTLMKAKGGNGNKVFCNNKYYITKEFVDYVKAHYDAPEEGLWIEFISITDNASWKVYNNFIEVAVKFKMFTSSVGAAYMYIGHNRIKALTIAESVIGKSGKVDSTWLVENNIFEETATELSSQNYYYLLTTVATEADGVAGTAKLLNNIFDTPRAILYNYKNSGGTPNSFYEATGNIFKIARTRNLFWKTSLNNVFIQKYDSLMASESDDFFAVFGNSSLAGIEERHMSAIYDNRKAAYASRFIYLEFYDGRNYSGWINVKTINVVNEQAQQRLAIDVIDGEIIIRDGDTNEELYRNALHPSESVSQYIGKFRLRLYPENVGVSVLWYDLQSSLAECEMFIKEEV